MKLYTYEYKHVFQPGSSVPQTYAFQKMLNVAEKTLNKNIFCQK